MSGNPVNGAAKELRNVGIFVFEAVEALDFAGPYEVFTTASRAHARENPTGAPLFKVFTIGQSTSLLHARAGLSVLREHDFAGHPPIDLLVVPGGVVSGELLKPDVIDWIRQSSSTATLTASVCTGSFLLAAAGLLEGKRATTHWEDIDDMRTMFAGVSVQSGPRWVDEGQIVTSAGISAGIDMSLHLVERLASRELAERTARQLDFDWTE